MFVSYARGNIWHMTQTIFFTRRTDYKDGEKIAILHCRPEYHEECINKWLTVKNNCAICKSATLPTEKKDKEVVNIRGNRSMLPYWVGE
ncbi:hypothetical protein KY285_010159 [Solanum tuberosum]|nr:hypothetical protein KY289_010697 [Solanum tuberosum]KAH0734452.1 hypothetical protein KY285_010159 [Solanum tuberosum]